MRKLVILLFIILLSVPAFATDNNKIVLAPTTSATQSDQFTVGQNQLATVVFTGTVAATETGTIQASHDDGTTWVSDSRQLTDTELILVVVGPGRFRVDKTATAAAAGITVLY